MLLKTLHLLLTKSEKAICSTQPAKKLKGHPLNNWCSGHKDKHKVLWPDLSCGKRVTIEFGKAKFQASLQMALSYLQMVLSKRSIIPPLCHVNCEPLKSKSCNWDDSMKSPNNAHIFPTVCPHLFSLKERIALKSPIAIHWDSSIRIVLCKAPRGFHFCSYQGYHIQRRRRKTT